MRRFLALVAVLTIGGLATAAWLARQGEAVALRGNFSLLQAKEFDAFPVYFLGESHGGYPLEAAYRVATPDAAPEEMRQDTITFIYGNCNPPPGSRCPAPLSVQIWSACMRYANGYDILRPDEELTVRGVPAAFYEGWGRLELYTGRATVVIFAPPHSRDYLIDAAISLRGLNRLIGRGEPLPPPAAGALDGRMSGCE